MGDVTVSLAGSNFIELGTFKVDFISNLLFCTGYLIFVSLVLFDMTGLKTRIRLFLTPKDEFAAILRN